MTGTKRAGTLVCVLLFFYAASARSGFFFSPRCVEAQKHMLCLRLDQARILLAEERKLNPSNVAVDYLENAADFYYLITSQQPDELRRLERNKDIRLEKIRASDPSSPYYLSTMADINLQWAFARVFNQELISAAWEIRTAYQLIESNRKKFPGFLPDLKNMGLIQSVLGTIPENYKWVLSIAGMKGDYNGGLAMIRSYLDNPGFKDEQLVNQQSSQFYYTLLLLNFGNKGDCWNFCSSVTADHDENLMSCYLRAFCGMRTGHTDNAIQTLVKRPSGPSYSSFVALDYLLGSAKLNRLDRDADIYLKRFVSFNKGKNLVKDAYKKISWYYLLQHDTAKFLTYRGLSGKYGAAGSDEDRNAQKEAESGLLPNATLIRARLLFDGGYYPAAEEVVNQINAAELPTSYQRIEYHYRYARILHESNKLSKAIDEYHETINLSRGLANYFAPGSCLQLGYLYLHLGLNDLAKTYFEKALDYHGYEYRSSVAQKAKAALGALR